MTYADVRSMWKPLICNVFHWQLTPDVRYLIEKVLVQHIQNLNAVMHHYIMDSDSQYPKLWVWLTYANVRSVWKPLICNFFPDSCLLMSDISLEKVLVQYIQHLNTGMHHFMIDFGSKYPKWCVWFTSANRLKRGKSVYLQFLTVPVASWCQTSHRKGFGAIYPEFEHRLCIIISCWFWLKIYTMMCLIHICNRWKRGKAVYLQFIIHDSCTPDVRYLTEKVLV